MSSVWSVPYNLNTDWFANATLVPELLDASPRALAAAANASSVLWVGTLNTAASGFSYDRVPYAARADAKTGDIDSYTAVGVLPGEADGVGPGSETFVVVDRKFGPPDAALFELPEQCASLLN